MLFRSENRIIDVPFIKFKDYCSSFEFDMFDFLKGHNEDIVKDIKKLVKAHIIDQTTIIPFILFKPLEIVEKHTSHSTLVYLLRIYKSISFHGDKNKYNYHSYDSYDEFH